MIKGTALRPAIISFLAVAAFLLVMNFAILPKKVNSTKKTSNTSSFVPAPGYENVNEAFVGSTNANVNSNEVQEGWKSYENKTGGYQFSYPMEWSVYKSTNISSGTSIIPPEPCDGVELCPYFGFSVVGIIPDVAPADASSRDIAERYDCIQNRRSITVNGIISTRQDESCFATLVTTYVPHENQFVRVRWPEVFVDGNPTYEHILATLTLIEPTIKWKTYTNNKYHYSIRYPGDYMLSIGSEQRVTLTKEVAAPPDNYLGGSTHSVRIDIDDGVNRIPFTKPELEWMTWAVNGFNQPFPAGYINKRSQTLGKSTFTVFNIASGIDTVVEYFMVKDTLVYRMQDSRLGETTIDTNKEIISTFTFID